MEDNLLNKLANIAVIRQHIHGLINSNNGIDRKNINPIQKIGRELDEEFVRLLLDQPDKIEIIRSVAIESTTFQDITEKDVKKEPSDTRPKIKTSKKVAK